MCFEKRDAISFALIAAMFFTGVLVYPRLPESVPTHWNAEGVADGFGPKAVALFFMPALAVFLYVVFSSLPSVDPYRKNYEKFKDQYFAYRLGFVLFLAAFYLATIFYITVREFDMTVAMVFMLSCLFYLLGAILPKIKQNFFIGIRTPWALASETVWDKTHRAAGKMYKAAASLSLIGLLFGNLALWFCIASILVASLFLVMYSYSEFKKQKVQPAPALAKRRGK